MKVKVQKRGRITLPKELRHQARIREGQWLQVMIQDSQVLLQPVDTADSGLILTKDHPIWKLLGRWGSGRSDISNDKYSHLAHAYEPKH